MELILARIFAFYLLTCIFTFKLQSQYDEENGKRNEPSQDQKYRPYFYSMYLPICLGISLVLGCCFYGPKESLHMFLSSCFSVFLHITCYYAILLCLLPLLRKHISARSCAFLWLVPNYLYVVVICLSESEAPLFILHAPGKLIWWLLGIWLLGFTFVMLWKIVSHLRFRHFVLKGAAAVTNPDIIELWKAEAEKTYIPKVPHELLISANISTPMTIGLFKGTMKLVLPQKQYSLDELALIFRHELVHIGREDNWSKFFLVFCTAMCWFNPLMWIAVEKCAQDVELSCDETVLIYADDTIKRNYAELILETAGDERGFTTCLSVKAKSLHYRLKNILHPRKHFSGITVVGIISFLLMFTCGHIALAYGDTTGKEIIFANEDIDQFKFYEIYDHSVENADSDTLRVLCTNEKELLRYLETLPISELTGNYYFTESEYKIILTLDTDDRRISLSFSDEILQMSVFELLANGKYTEYTYYLPEGIDWDIMYSYISDYPIVDMTIDRVGQNTITCSPTLQIVRERDSEKSIVLQNNVVLEDIATITGYEPPYTAKFYFSEELVSDFYIDVEKLDGSDSCTLNVSNDSYLNAQLPVDPAYYPAKFTVHATFDKYEAEYVFIVE